MTGVIATLPKIQFSNALGLPMSGGTLTSYLAGTTTLAATYQDEALTAANANPIALDSRGECVLWLDSTKTYKFVLKNALGVVQWTVDRITNSTAFAKAYSDSLDAAFRSDLAAPSGASLISYMPDGATAISLQNKLRKYVDLKEHGVIADGVTDDTAAMNAVLAKFGTVDIKNLSIAYSGNLLMPDNGVLFSSTRAGKLIRTGTSRIAKTELSVLPLVLDETVSNGNDTIKLGSASYAGVNVGDFIRISSDSAAWNEIYPRYESATSAQLNDISNDIFKEQVVKVLSKGAANTIRFEGSALGNYFLGTAVVAKLSNFYNSISIDGITFVNSVTAENAVAENCPVNMQGVYKLSLTNCNFELNSRSGGMFFMYGSVHVKNNTFNSANTLAIFLIRAVNNSVISENVFSNQVGGDSSLFISTACYSISVANNCFYGSHYKSLPVGSNYVAAIDLSARSNCVTVNGNTFNGYNVGVRFLFGSYKNVVSSNTFQNCNVSAVNLGNAPYNLISSNTITSCATLTNGQAAIHGITSDFLSVLVNSVTSQTPVNQLFMSGVGGVCVSNTFFNTIQILFSQNNGVFSNNKVTNLVVGSGYVFTISGATSHYNKVESNSFSGLSLNGAIRIANGSECNIVASNLCSMNAGTMITLASTSNAQSINNNVNANQNYHTLMYQMNVSITGPAKPINAKLPVGFRIYSSSTNLEAAQGTTYWEYVNGFAGSPGHVFIACIFTPTVVVLPE